MHIMYTVFNKITRLVTTDVFPLRVAMAAVGDTTVTSHVYATFLRSLIIMVMILIKMKILGIRKPKHKGSEHAYYVHRV